MKNFIFALFFGLTVAIAPLARADLAVFATVPEWGALAKEIGGDKVKVYTATTALQDPHRIDGIAVPAIGTIDGDAKAKGPVFLVTAVERHPADGDAVQIVHGEAEHAVVLQTGGLLQPCPLQLYRRRQCDAVLVECQRVTVQGRHIAQLGIFQPPGAQPGALALPEVV